VKQILKVAPLTPIEVAQMAEAEKALGVSRGVYEQRQREYLAAVDALMKKHDPNFEKNSKQTINRYKGVIVDRCLVITFE
jgi:hypothetical protein